MRTLFGARFETSPYRARLCAMLLAPVVLMVVAAPSVVFILNMDQDRPDTLGDFLAMLFGYLLFWGGAQLLLTLVGVAFWIILHRVGWRHWSAAIVLGFVTVFVPTFLWLNRHSPWNLAAAAEDAIGASMFAGCEAVIAFVLWAIAYRPGAASRPGPTDGIGAS